MFRSSYFADVSLNQWIALTTPKLGRPILTSTSRRWLPCKDKPVIVGPTKCRPRRPEAMNSWLHSAILGSCLIWRSHVAVFLGRRQVAPPLAPAVPISRCKATEEHIWGVGGLTWRLRVSRITAVIFYPHDSRGGKLAGSRFDLLREAFPMSISQATGHPVRSSRRKRVIVLALLVASCILAWQIKRLCVEYYSPENDPEQVAARKRKRKRRRKGG